MPSNVSATDMELINAFRSGEMRAAEDLYGRYYPRVLGLCKEYYHSPADAEDAAQIVFIKVIVKKHIFDYRGDGQLWTWLYRITANTCKSLLRKKNCWQYVPDPLLEIMLNHAVQEKTCKPKEEILNLRKKTNLKIALQNLPLRYRQVVVAVYFNDKTYLETAGQLRLPPATVGVNLLRAKKKLGHLYRIENRKAAFSPADVFLLQFEKIASTA